MSFRVGTDVNLTRSLIEEIHTIAKQSDLVGPARRERYEAIHDRIDGSFAKGELAASHRDMLFKLIVVL